MHSSPHARRTPRSLVTSIPAQADDGRVLSRDACRTVADRFFAKTHGGGDTKLNIGSQWYGTMRWARNKVTAGSDLRFTDFTLSRRIRGATGSGTTNSSDDAMIQACVDRVEALVRFRTEDPDQLYPDTPAVTNPHTKPVLWFDATYGLDAEARGQLAEARIAQVEGTGFLSAAYLQTSANGIAVVDTGGLFRYYPTTLAEFSVTVRTPKTGGSGWAGVDFNDWRRIDTAALMRIAIDKCERSRNPVAVEPGRYTAVLEPQAVCDLFAPVFAVAMEREPAERGSGPFAAGGGNSKIGERVLDSRITVSADPMDPDCGFVPFDFYGEPHVKVNWFEQGVLKELSYPRSYGLQQLNKDAALPNSGAFHMTAVGATATVDEMIATTERGLLVTRFNNIQLLDRRTLMLTGNTRDGIWLIEKGKISKPVKNFRFTESPLFAFNNVEQIGVPQRVYRRWSPAVVPPVKVRDFSFTALMDAV